ncbi:MAG TPA: hypothetical protein VK186_02415 [Candidatus Deferrimicrobium sp.]|nr:hypothetical protein [Candidatus Deferrimicrobium sp.]
MKKNILIVMIMFLISAVLWSQDTRDPKGIVDKCIAALGGVDAVKKQLDYSAEGQFKIAVHMMEISGDVKWIVKAPKSWNKFKATFAGNEMTQTQSFDGKNAWMERMGIFADQPVLNYESDLDHTIGLLIEKNATFALAKETEFEGKKAIGIEANVKGKKTTFYIDSETFLPLEIAFEDYYFGENATRELMEKRIRCLEYKNISGVSFPTKTAIFLKGKKFIELDFNHVTFNRPVSADIFARPDQEMDLRYSEEMVN